MTTFKSFYWGFAALLIASLFAAISCTSNTTSPITPADDPGDVLAVGDGGGGSGSDIGQEDISGLVSVYNDLKTAGGGATIVPDNDYVLIGAFDRWTKEPVKGQIVIVEDDGQYTVFYATGAVLFEALTFPITVFYTSVDDYVSTTVVDTNANVIALGLQHYRTSESGARVFNSYLESPDGSLFGTDPFKVFDVHTWAVVSKSTHTNYEWYVNRAQSDYPYTALTAPNSLIYTNTDQPAGGVGFLYDYDGLITDPTPLGFYDPADYGFTLIGYYYENFGPLNHDSKTYWTEYVDYSTSSLPNNYSDGNWTIDPGMLAYGGAQVRVEAGGGIGNSWEFVPYGLPDYVQVDTDTGAYNVSAYDPPFAADRECTYSTIRYANGSSELRLTDWNPAGGTLPDIDFSVPPAFDTIDFNLNGLYDISWSNDATEGILILKLIRNGQNYREIILPSDLTELPSGLQTIPAFLQQFDLYPDEIRLVRIDCAGTGIDNWDYATFWTSADSFSLSAAAGTDPLPPAP